MCGEAMRFAWPYVRDVPKSLSIVSTLKRLLAKVGPGVGPGVGPYLMDGKSKEDDRGAARE